MRDSQNTTKFILYLFFSRNWQSAQFMEVEVAIRLLYMLGEALPASHGAHFSGNMAKTSALQDMMRTVSHRTPMTHVLYKISLLFLSHAAHCFLLMSVIWIPSWCPVASAATSTPQCHWSSSKQLFDTISSSSWSLSTFQTFWWVTLITWTLKDYYSEWQDTRLKQTGVVFTVRWRFWTKEDWDTAARRSAAEWPTSSPDSSKLCSESSFTHWTRWL